MTDFLNPKWRGYSRLGLSYHIVASLSHAYQFPMVRRIIGTVLYVNSGVDKGFYWFKDGIENVDLVPLDIGGALPDLDITLKHTDKLGLNLHSLPNVTGHFPVWNETHKRFENDDINKYGKIIVNHIFDAALENDAITYNLGKNYRHVQVVIHQIARNNEADGIGLNIRINGINTSVYWTIATTSTFWGINCGRFNHSAIVCNISAPGSGYAGGNFHYKYFTAIDIATLLHRNVTSSYHTNFVNGISSVSLITSGFWAVGTSVTIIGFE